MALVSYTQSAAGEPMQFTMNKNDLLAVPKVMADPFFYLESNWFRVSFVFKHTTSGKRFVPSFRTFSATKYLKIRSGMNGGDGFELKKIIISKSDRTFLVIKTSEIPSVADYAFSLMSSGGGGGSGTAIPWSASENYYVNAQNEIVSNLSALNSSESSMLYSSTSYPIGDGVEFKYIINSDTFLNGFTFIGFKNNSEEYSAFYSDYRTDQLGIRNNLNGIYSRPSNSVVEFKIQVRPTITFFYVDGIKVATGGPVFSGDISTVTLTPAVRFKSDFNMTNFTVTNLPPVGGAPNPNAVNWNNLYPQKYYKANNGYLEKLVNGSQEAGITTQTTFGGPFEITYTFNGFLSEGSAIGFGNESGVWFHYGFGHFLTFNGTNNPKLGTSHNGGSNITGYGFSELSSGLNTVTFKMNAGGNTSVIINGTEITIGSLTPSSIYYVGARLLAEGEKIESAYLVLS